MSPIRPRARAAAAAALLLVLLGAAVGWWGWWKGGFDPWRPGRAGGGSLKERAANLPPYSQQRAGIEARRRELGEALGAAGQSEAAREETLDAARRLLVSALARDLPAYWLGTPWDFNGTSQTPGEGRIACGYFVATLLRDAGFAVERIPLAQQPSGNILRTLTGRGNITRTVGASFDEFRAALRASGPGVYVIGLDRHVGLIAQGADGRASFIHSDGGRHRCVVVEPVSVSESLRRSRWREFGNLASDEVLLTKWLRGEAFATVR